MKISQLLWDLFDLSLTGMAGVTRRVAFMQQPPAKPPPSAGITEEVWSRAQSGKTYLRALFRLTLYCLGFPLLILALGMLSDLGWLVATVGIFWTICSLSLLILAAPVGMLIETILGGIKGIGTRYVRFSLGLFLIELLFSLFISIVPIQNNPSALPVVIIASAILGIIGALSARTPAIQRLIGALVTVILIIFTLSFFFPQTFKSVTNLGSKLDLQIAKRMETPGPQSGDPVGAGVNMNQSGTSLKQPPYVPSGRSSRSSAVGNATPDQSPHLSSSNLMHVRRILGVAYSYSKDRWAVVDPLFGPLHGNGSYPHPYLVFWSGLVSGHGAMEWDGSNKLVAGQLSVLIANLKVGRASVLQEFYTDIGVGYDVLLENAVFSDYTMAKTLMVFRTFSGDSPPSNIEKSFEVVRVEMRKEQPYLISGEWSGSFQSRQEDDTPETIEFTGRFVQDGNRFDGVMVESGYKKQGWNAGPTRARARVEGVIVDGKVTFVKTYKGQIIGVSYVGSYVRDVQSLEGSWYSGVHQLRWNMTRRGEFTGSPDDILSVDNSRSK